MTDHTEGRTALTDEELAAIRLRTEMQIAVDRTAEGLIVRNLAEAVDDRYDLLAEVDRLRAENTALRAAYGHACAERDKYMRRTIEWRTAALDGTAVTVACTGCNGCEACNPALGGDQDGGDRDA